MKTRKSLYPLSKTYLLSFVCLKCQKSFKRPIPEEGFERKCPQCNDVLISLGRHFKPPGKTEDKQWEKVRLLVANGFFFQKLYDENGVGIPYPGTLVEAKEFVVKYKHLALKIK